jgi:hypothetical protein
MTEKTIKARVLRDFWAGPDETSRVRAGTVVDVSTDTLIDGLEKGVLERVKEK